MRRREFLKFTGSGIAAIAVGSAGGWSMFRPRVAQAAGPIDLTMIEADHEMVDGVLVPAWAFSTALAPEGGAPLGPRVPGPVLFVTEGQTVTLTVANQIANGGEHGFEILGVPGTLRESIPSNGTPVEITFKAPTAGTYMYLDPRNAPVNRVMGLHGAMVVLPSPIGHLTPYSTPTQAITNLFSDFGVAEHFPGHPWDRERNTIWLFSSLDPVKHALAAASGAGVSPTQFTRAGGYLPQYFTINGKSGFFAAQHGADSAHAAHGNTPDSQSNISIHGYVGQPMIIRSLQAGLMWQSPHIHGNHVYQMFDYDPAMGVDRTIRSQLHLVDTWTIPPLSIKDVLLPYIAPPDIPPNFWQRAAAGQNDELFPLLYPMHDHQEVSNTAAGGNYPQGAATHFQFEGAMRNEDEVIVVDSAELRVRTGELLLSGRISRNRVSTQLDILGGHGHTGPVIGQAQVTSTADGLHTWTFRGRALKALNHRAITVVGTGAGSSAMVHDVPLTNR